MVLTFRCVKKSFIALPLLVFQLKFFMKKIITAIIVAASIFIFQSCSQKFNVAAPYKQIVVVYGILDQKDTAHYVRIEKAFLDQSKNALTMAQVSDSSYFAQLNVIIKRFDFSYNQIDTIQLNRVDMSAEGYPKASGTFFNAPNYAYKFKGLLNPNYIYRLVITNPTIGLADSAETPIINDMDNTVFTFNKLDDTDLFTNKINFASVLSGRYLDLPGTYVPPSNFSFNGYISPVGLAQVVFRFNWNDSNGSTGKITSKYYDYDLGYSALSGGSFDYQASNYELYNGLFTGMGCAPANIYRQLGPCQLFVYLATYDFANYLQANSLSGTGISGSDIQPTYTNIKGTGGALGLFTCKGARSGYVLPDVATVDSLEASTIINGCCQLHWTTF